MDLFQVIGEAIESVFPGFARVIDPFGRGGESFGIEAAGAALGVAASLDEACLLEDFEVARDGGEADVERGGKLEDGGVAGGEASDDRAPRGVGEGGERGIELLGSCGHWEGGLCI